MGFNAQNCYICLKKHPFVSCILLFYFSMYMFLPYAFNVLIYIAPLIVIGGVVDRFFCSIDSKSMKNVKEKDNRNNGFVQDDHNIVDKNESSSAHIEKVRQRNVKKEKNKEDCVVKDKNPISSTSFSGNFVDKTTVEEENPKEIREVEVDYRIGKGEKEMAEIRSLRYEEEAKRSRDKVIEWTKDDQKSPMDLGVFEVERTKRLESLMTKRRARKQLSLQVRKTPMKVGGNEPYGQITSIYIPKSNPFLSNNTSIQGSTPGSAPSCLIPMKNPFALPYEPYEEKLKLTEDSFQQQFMTAQQKEIMYCRHESFNWAGVLPWECKHDQHETLLYHGFATPRVCERPQKNKFGHPLDKGGMDNASEVQITQTLAKDYNGGLSSLFSPKANSLTFSDPKTRAEERHLYAVDKEMNHTPTNSIASDMQVEVSELGSPLLTVDGNNSSSDEESLINDMVSGNEELISVTSNVSGLDKLEFRLREVSVSSNLSGMDKSESRSRDINGIAEQDCKEIDSRLTKDSESTFEKLYEENSSSSSAGSIDKSNTISKDFSSIAIDTKDGSQGQVDLRATGDPLKCTIISIEEAEDKSEKVTMGSLQ